MTQSGKLRLHWQIEHNSKVIFAQRAQATVESLKSTFQGCFAPQAPHVAARTRYTLRLALADGAKVVRDTAIEFEVFPAMAPVQRPSVGVVGSGLAPRLLREVGVKPVSTKSAAVILVDDFAAYQRERRTLDQAVAAGARLVFLELPIGEYDIGGSPVRVVDCVMRPREFVSRATGHPLVAGFEPEDFKCWHDSAAGYFRPLLSTLFEADGWQPVLTNGNGVWGGGAWVRMLAAAEKPAGLGAYLICQIHLLNRTKTNPAAAIFARRLLGVAENREVS